MCCFYTNKHAEGPNYVTNFESLKSKLLTCGTFITSSNFLSCVLSTCSTKIHSSVLKPELELEYLEGLVNLDCLVPSPEFLTP